MTRNLLVPALAVAVLGGTVPLAGHHSFAAFYHEEQRVSIEGSLTELDYRSPHAWVHVVVTDGDGRSQTFSAEWANPTRLKRDGITKDTLKPGDHVVVTGAPGRNAAENRLHLKGIHRPADGWSWGDRGARR